MLSLVCSVYISKLNEKIAFERNIRIKRVNAYGLFDRSINDEKIRIRISHLFPSVLFFEVKRPCTSHVHNAQQEQLNQRHLNTDQHNKLDQDDLTNVFHEKVLLNQEEIIGSILISQGLMDFGIEQEKMKKQHINKDENKSKRI